MNQTELPGTLARKSVINLGWLTATHYALIVIGFGVSILLARLLSPTDFGTVALASSIGDIIFTLLAGWSFSLTVLQDQERTPDLESSAFVLTCLVGLGVLLLSLLIAPILGNIYRDNTIGIVFLIFTAGNCLQLLAGYWGMLLERALNYRRHASVNFIAQTLGMASGVIMALRGWGLWSLVLPTLVMNTGLLIGMGVSTRFRASFCLSGAAVRRLFHMGARWLVSQWLEFAFIRFDNFVIGSFIGRQQLGYYNRAYNTAELGVRAAVPIATTYSMPLYSRLQSDRQRLSVSFKYLSTVIMALSGVIALCWLTLSSPIVRLLYGEKWLLAAPILQALSIHAFLRPLVSHVTVLIYAKGMPGKIVRIKAIQFALFVPGLLLAASQGIQYVPWVINLNQLLGLILTYREVAHWVDVDWKRYWLVPIGEVTAIAIVVSSLTPLLSQWPPIAQLPVGGLVIAGCYVVLLVLFERRSLLSVWQILRSNQGFVA